MRISCDLTEVKVSGFRSEGATSEYHLTVRPLCYGSAEEQLAWIEDAYKRALDRLEIRVETAVFRRFACSDLPNQCDPLRGNGISNPDSEESPGAVSWVNQPPLAPAKLVLWAYHVVDPSGPLELTKSGAFARLQRKGLEHHWAVGLSAPGSDSSYEQSESVFADYLDYLEGSGQSLADDVIRTWFFVKDVNAFYNGLVEARNAVFARHGLGESTHTIASTGIEGGSFDVAAKVSMDAYSIKGVGARQLQFLEAPDYLSSTHRYGVAFERGVAVAYRDRKQIFISGTASIDRDGEVLFPGDLYRQWERVLVNIEALMKVAGGGLDDLNVMLVYHRDPSEGEQLNEWMQERFPDTPFVVLVAPVCRSGWLVEIEAVGIVPNEDDELPEF